MGFEACFSAKASRKIHKAPAPATILTYADRLYLASYSQPPSVEDTLFPYPNPIRSPAKSPAKLSHRAAEVVSSSNRKRPYYFSVDDTLLYNAFHHDFGPLHIGHVYRFAYDFHVILAAKENEGTPIVFWSKTDPRSRANASCLLACYMVLIQSWAPHMALAPIAQVNPPLMPFRDAGYSQADYGITVQDVVYGVWRAKAERCCVLDDFSLEEYERYERVEHGDFNWVTPHFLAFASPQHTPVARTVEGTEAWEALPKSIAEVDAHASLPPPFKEVLTHFKERGIGLVVRLNSQLYDPSYFEALGMTHLDMIFDDGTCPPLSMVRKFIRLAHEMISRRKKAIAVHCKAGLGRTGCLIGAYLIYRYRFTANEAIAFMRFMRPGMVVGPQQHWLHLNQGTFREWWVLEQYERKLRKEAGLASSAASAATTAPAKTHQPSTPIRAMQKTNLGRSSGKTNVGASTPPNCAVHRSPLCELDRENSRDNSIGPQEDHLPAPTPGQPRKTRRLADRRHAYPRSSHAVIVQEETATAERRDKVSVREPNRGSEEAEEWQVRMRSHRNRPATPKSPDRLERSVSHQTSTTTTTTVYQIYDRDASPDVENRGPTPRSKDQASRVSSASGILAKVRGNTSAKRSSSGVREAGVRKSSGRVGSVGHSGHSSTSAAVASAATTARKFSGL